VAEKSEANLIIKDALPHRGSPGAVLIHSANVYRLRLTTLYPLVVVMLDED
jgi:hypothetical protein